jgi:hypothetical protein
MHLSFHRLLLAFLSKSLCLHLLVLKIATTLQHDVSRALSRFVDFSNSLKMSLISIYLLSLLQTLKDQFCCKAALDLPQHAYERVWLQQAFCATFRRHLLRMG